jgi:hypothetical protein
MPPDRTLYAVYQIEQMEFGKLAREEIPSDMALLGCIETDDQDAAHAAFKGVLGVSPAFIISINELGEGVVRK